MAAGVAEEDVFCRQRVLRAFKHDEIANKTAMISGVGGVGAPAAMTMCRLGVKHLILVDFDKVEIHNLNRQILYGREHVGRDKVTCSAEVLTRFMPDPARQTIEAVNIDAVKEWGRYVELARRCDVIINSIDVGDTFTAAICSLGLALGIPVVEGGTEPLFGHTVMGTAQPPRPHAEGVACFCCQTETLPKDVVSGPLHPSRILEQTDLSAICTPEPAMAGGSTSYSATFIGNILCYASMRLLGVVEHEPCPTRFILSLPGMSLDQFRPEASSACPWKDFSLP